MAFINTKAIEVTDGEDVGQRIVLIPLYQTDEGLTYSVRSMLSPFDVYDEPGWEFSYEIVVDDLNEDATSYTTQDRYIVANAIPDDIRSKILPCAVVSCVALVEDVQPNRIYRVSKGRNLPEKALTKHHIVSGAFTVLGYDIVETGFDQFGRAYWIMEPLLR